METRTSRYFSEHSKPKEDNSQDQLILPKRRRKSDTNEPYIPSSLSATVPMARRIRLDEVFFNQEATQLAKALLGKILVRSVDNPNGKEQICGRIVETEAYLGMEDKGSHTFQQRRTARTEAMFMKPGTIYVYFIYGMYNCMNISSEGAGAGVLLRAIEPVSGLELMESFRKNKSKTQQPARSFKPHQLCNGPSKLCISFGIDGQFDRGDLTSSASPVWLEEWEPQQDLSVVTCSRIGLSKKAEEWINSPLRFYIRGCPSVSVIDRIQENKSNAANIDIGSASSSS